MIVPLPKSQIPLPVRTHAPLPLPHTFFDMTIFFTKSFPFFQLLSRSLIKTLVVLASNVFSCADRATLHVQEKLRAWGGACQVFSQESVHGRLRGA